MDFIKKVKRLTKWENIFTNYIFDEELVSRLYKEDCYRLDVYALPPLQIHILKS